MGTDKPTPRNPDLIVNKPERRADEWQVNLNFAPGIVRRFRQQQQGFLRIKISPHQHRSAAVRVKVERAFTGLLFSLTEYLKQLPAYPVITLKPGGAGPILLTRSV